MTSKPYAIIFDTFDEPHQQEEFIEEVRSLFRAKMARDNMIVIINDKGLTAKEIHELLASKLDFSFDIIVTEFATEYYGTFHAGCIDWLKENYPDLPWL